MIKKTNKNSNRKRYAKGQTVRDGLATREKESNKKKPIRKPIPQAPRKPIQPGIPSKNTRNIEIGRAHV